MDTGNIKEKAKGLTIRVLVIFAVFVVILLLFWHLTDEVVFEKENGFDEKVYLYITGFTSPTITRLMEFLTFFGSRDFLLPAYLSISIYYLLFQKNTRTSLSVSAIGLAGAGVLFILKQSFQRHRPLKPLLQNVDGFSYPSGHSFSAFTFGGILIFLIWQSKILRGWKWFYTIAFLLLAVLIAFTRVYLHVHFPTDVIAGFILSLLWLTICYVVLLKMGKLGAKNNL